MACKRFTTCLVVKRAYPMEAISSSTDPAARLFTSVLRCPSFSALLRLMPALRASFSSISRPRPIAAARSSVRRYCWIRLRALAVLTIFEPVPARAAVLVGDDFHRVAALERGIQRNQLAVDLRAQHTRVAHLRMDEEGEVQRRRTFGEFLYVARGREDIDFVLEEIHAQGVHEFLGVGFLPLPGRRSSRSHSNSGASLTLTA